MKKLMIAAAAAAMISGGFAADELGYDFTASVKTTQGKGNTVKTTYNVSLGQDASGWWYENGDVRDFLLLSTGIDIYSGKSQKDRETKAKKAMGKLKDNDAKIAFIQEVTGETFPDALKKITDMNKKATYVLFDGTDTMFDEMELYKKKYVWCYTFKVTDTATDCYRAPTTVKLTGSLFMTNCCAEVWELVVKNFGTTYLPDEQLDVTHPLLYRINGITLEKANKVEVTGVIGPEGFDSYDGKSGGDYNDTAVGTFAYAGQGDFDVKAEQIKNISGDIVGVLADPDCEDCCLDDDLAMFFMCEDEDDTITEWTKPIELDNIYGTAAFGTFSIKYNKKTTR